MINKYTVLERKLQLMDDREKTGVERDRLTALFHALSGAIQDCDWTLSEMEEESPTPDAT